MIKPFNNTHSSYGAAVGSMISGNSKLHLMNEWKEWAQKGQDGAGEQRDIALSRLIACREHGISTLDLSNLNLTDLPKTLPDNLWDLTLSHNQLTHLPDKLPDSIREIYVTHNQLMYLPECLPPKLGIMNVSHNQIRCLPKIFPEGLTNLNLSYNALVELPRFRSQNLQDLLVDNNQLRAIDECLPNSLLLLSLSYNNLPFLPENLPSELKTLNINHNHLTHLPRNLPSELDALEADHNQLLHLPEYLPPQLSILNVSHNLLTHLPENLPSELDTLEADHNQLTHLPANLPSELEILDVSYNQLAGVPVNLPMMMSTVNINHNNIGVEETLIFYFTRTLNQLDAQIDINLWKNIAQEDNASVFFEFLIQLFQGDNASSVKLKQIVSNWLKELGKDENADLRAQTFEIAKEGTESCVDRTSFYFNQMYSSMVEHRLIKNGAPIQVTFQTLIGLYRLQELESIAAEHTAQHRVHHPDFDEDIEIYFAYQYCLRETLELPIYTELQFSNLAKLTESNLAKAKTRIIEKEKYNFIPYLVNDSEVWKKKVTNWNSDKVKAADDLFLKRIEEVTSDASMNLYDVTDKNKTDRVHYEIYFPLTKAFLEENNMFWLLKEFHY